MKLDIENSIYNKNLNHECIFIMMIKKKHKCYIRKIKNVKW